jgi:16S rRNA C967 or C1407 C5-methylase (RsmB/RsmF family)
MRSKPKTLPKAPAEPAVLKAFDELWKEIFSSPVHLDSALAKRIPKIKSVLAQIVPSFLLRPASTAEAVGVGMPELEPWTLAGPKLAAWRPARLVAERLHSSMIRGAVMPEPVEQDFPPRMIEEWKRDWGNDVAAGLVATLAREAPLSLRAARVEGAETLLKKLGAKRKLPVKAQISDVSPMGVRLAGYVPVLSGDWGRELHEKGAFEIQDEGSQLMAFFALWPELFAARLQKRPGAFEKSFKLPELPKDTQAWNVVDACAGAGGKTLALGDALHGKGRVYAYDVSVKKLQALKRRASRAGLRNVQAVPVPEGKEAESLSRFRRTAQVVLVDAPCSGWGVLRRNPDIKWRQDDASLERMPALQKRLLGQYGELVAPGGRLVFGVCTFRKAETLDVVEAFLKEHPDFTAGPGGYVGPGPTDGFFMQAFERRAKDAK